MITFFSFDIDTKDQQFQTIEEARYFVEEFVTTTMPVSEVTQTVVNYINSIKSSDNMLLNSIDVKEPGDLGLRSTKTFVSETKAQEFASWYTSTGHALLQEMFSGLGWETSSGIIHYLGLDDDEEREWLLSLSVSSSNKLIIDDYLLTTQPTSNSV